MPRLYRGLRVKAPEDAVTLDYEGRWSNPFKSGVHGDKQECVDKYRDWLLAQPSLLAKAQRELTGKPLYCACIVGPCHGTLLLEVANTKTAREELDELI